MQKDNMFSFGNTELPGWGKRSEIPHLGGLGRNRTQDVACMHHGGVTAMFLTAMNEIFTSNNPEMPRWATRSQKERLEAGYEN